MYDKQAADHLRDLMGFLKSQLGTKVLMAYHGTIGKDISTMSEDELRIAVMLRGLRRIIEGKAD